MSTLPVILTVSALLLFLIVLRILLRLLERRDLPRRMADRVARMLKRERSDDWLD